MNDEMRDIIAKVAAGSLTPEEAATRLEELEHGGSVATATSPAAAPAPGETARTVSVSIALGLVTVIGDASIREAVAEGPHTARHEGDRLIIEGDPLNSSGFVFGSSSGWIKGSRPWKDPVVVRMNPDLALELTVQGGKASVRAVRGPIKAEIHAGAIDLVGFESPIDISAEAGAVKASGRLSTGSSRIRCDAGSVKLDLGVGSNLRVTARSELGQVKLDGKRWRTEPHADGTRETAVLGTGEGTLDVDVNVGAVRIFAS